MKASRTKGESMATQATSNDSGMPDERLLSELVRRIVESVKPRRIILFGSAARGKMGPNSDLDVLLVMPDGVHRRRTAQQAYRSLRALGVSKDVIVVTEGDVRQHSENHSLILHPALKEGKELYRAVG